MLNLKTKALYISLFVILILIILNQNSFVFSQSTLPVCVSPRSLIVWPNMTPNTVPMASTSDGILRNSYIKFGTINAASVFHSIFDTLYIYSQLDRSGNNVITNPAENRTNWVIVNRGALYTTGPRNNFNSGGAIGFQDYSTDTTKLYHTIFTIDQSPYKFYDNNGNVGTSSSYGILRFNYGEFNPTNATITSPRLGNIPPGRSRWRAGLLSLTWEGNLGIGTTSPQAKLHVVDSAIISSGEAASLNIKGRGGQNIYNFAAVNLVDDRHNRIWHITHRSNANPIDENKLFFSYYNGSSWSNLLAIATTGNVGIGTTSPNAKLDVVGDAIVRGTTTASRFCLGNNCITNWPSGGTNYWTLSGNSLYATPTNVNVGIGTTSPQDKLHVSRGGIILEGGENVLKIIRPRATGGYARGVWFYNPTGTQMEAGIGFRGDGNNPPTRIYLTHGSDGWDSTRGIHILNNGNVGIGTITPSAKLHVIGNTIVSGNINANNINANNINASTTTASRFCLGNSCITNWPSGGTNYWILSGNRLYATPTNVNVGIGTTSPSAKLHVIGNVRADQFCLGNSCITNWPSGGTNYWILSGNRLYATPTNVNVGIGTNNPDPYSKLHIYSNNTWDRLKIETNKDAGISVIGKTTNGSGFVEFINNDNGNQWVIYHKNSNQNLSFAFYNASTRNWTDNILTLTNQSNVGIGTTSPQAKLHVVGSTIIQGSQKVYSSDGSRLLFEITEE